MEMENSNEIKPTPKKRKQPYRKVLIAIGVITSILMLLSVILPIALVLK